MTMWPRSGRAVPAGTAQVARAAFPKGCLAMRIRDALGELFEDVEFAGLFAVRGRPAVSPARLALVLAWIHRFGCGWADRAGWWWPVEWCECVRWWSRRCERGRTGGIRRCG